MAARKKKTVAKIVSMNLVLMLRKFRYMEFSRKDQFIPYPEQQQKRYNRWQQHSLDHP